MKVVYFWIYLRTSYRMFLSTNETGEQNEIKKNIYVFIRRYYLRHQRWNL